MRILGLIFLFLCCANSNLKAKTWTVSPDHSQIFFSVNYLKFSEVKGHFKRFNGKITLENKEIKNLEIFINSSSIYTGNNLRDGHLKRNDFLDVKKYPIITFKMNEMTNDTINGEIAIKNIVKKIKFDIKKSPIVKDPWKKESFFIEFKTKINRQDFGISWNQVLDTGGLLLEDTISIYGNLQWQPVGGSTLSSKHLISDTLALRKKERPKIHIPNLKEDLIIKTAPKQKPLVGKKQTKDTTHFNWVSWLSYAFVWLTSLSGVLVLAYKLKDKHNSWWVDLIVLTIIFVFALAAYQLMPN